MIRVLVVDDSVTARGLLARLLHADAEVLVVGEVGSGSEAVALARGLAPDVIVMDVNMPGMDGFEATKRIMFEAPTPVVIVSGVRASDEVQLSLEALRAGAVHAMPKPAGLSGPGFEEESRRFVRTIKAMSQVKVVRRWPDGGGTPPHDAPPVVGVLSRDADVRVVAMAASTGGPAALHRILSELPRDFGAPILIVQHISPGFTEGLARWLDAGSALRVKLGEDGEPLSPGSVYVAPEGRHLGVRSRGTVALSNAAPVAGFRPSATFLFASVAATFGTNCLAAMLTGMGHDGVEGLRDVKRVGGRIVVQDEATSVIFGMPGAAIAAGLGDVVLPISEIAAHLVQSIVPPGSSGLGT